MKIKNYQRRFEQALIRKLQLIKLRYEKCMTRKAFTGILQKVNEQYMVIDMKVKSMQHSVKSKLQNDKSITQNLILKLDSLSPLKTLARGYGIILKDGIVIKSKNMLRKEDEISIRMQDGETKAKII